MIHETWSVSQKIHTPNCVTTNMETKIHAKIRINLQKRLPVAHESHTGHMMNLGELVDLPPRQPEGCLQGSDVTMCDPWYCFYSQNAQTKSLNATNTKQSRYWQRQVTGQGCEETKSQSPLTCCLQALPIVSDLHWVPDSQVQESPKKAALDSHGWWRIKCNLLSFVLLFSPWTLPTWSCLASQSAVSHLSNQTNRNSMIDQTQVFCIRVVKTNSCDIESRNESLRKPFVLASGPQVPILLESQCLVLRIYF